MEIKQLFENGNANGVILFSPDFWSIPWLSKKL